jgi:hypothetical protein
MKSTTVFNKSRKEIQSGISRENPLFLFKVGIAETKNISRGFRQGGAALFVVPELSQNNHEALAFPGSTGSFRSPPYL